MNHFAILTHKLSNQPLTHKRSDQDKEIVKSHLAKIIGAATRSRTFKGGQHMLYMAPEGWRNETNTIQLDMYSLGIVLYEMASLQYPYQLPADRSDDGLRNMHFFQQPQPLQTLRPDLPLGFCHVVTRLMEKNPSDRFPTWADVQKELKAAWEQSLAPGPRVDVSVLLKESDRQREAFMRKQLAEEQRRADQAEQEQLDRYQMQKLKDQFKAVIDEYNDHCYITDKIKIEESALGLDLLFPYRSAVFLKSFPVDPPMNLKVGQVRIAAVLQDKKHSWLNYLLCRQGPDDYYGTWKVCVARDYTPNRRPEPFGFANPQEIRQIEHANQITTTLTAEFHDRVQESFLEVIQHAMKQPE